MKINGPGGKTGGSCFSKFLPLQIVDIGGAWFICGRGVLGKEHGTCSNCALFPCDLTHFENLAPAF